MKAAARLIKRAAAMERGLAWRFLRRLSGLILFFVLIFIGIFAINTDIA